MQNSLILAVAERPLLAHVAAKHLGVPVRTLRDWAKKGKISAFKDPQRPKIWLFPRTEIDGHSGGGLNGGR